MFESEVEGSALACPADHDSSMRSFGKNGDILSEAEPRILDTRISPASQSPKMQPEKHCTIVKLKPEHPNQNPLRNPSGNPSVAL